MKTGTNGRSGKGRGNLDSLTADVEGALQRTPGVEPGPAAKEHQPTVTSIVIPPLRRSMLEVVVKGLEDSTLITHRFPHGPLVEMLKGKDETKTKKRVLPPRIPDEEFRLALYVMDRQKRQLVAGPSELARLKAIDLNDRKKWAFVLPMGMFKGALIAATEFVPGITRAYVKQTLHVFGDFGDFGEILSDAPPRMREDIVKIGVWPKPKSPQLRYRPEFTDWKIKLRVRFIETFINEKQVGSLLQYAGFVAGVGELRPEKCGGTGGMFTFAE